MHTTYLKTTALIFAMLLPAIGATPTAAAPPPPPAQEQPALAVAPPREPEPKRPPAQNVNVKMDVKITDQSGSNAPVIKTLSLVLADRQNGNVRSQVEIPIRLPRLAPPAWNTEELPLRVDLRPDLVDGDRIKVHLVLNYRTVAEAANTTDGEPARKSEVTENVLVVLENNKPLIVSQSADAASDRKVTVELKALILR